MLLVHGLLHLCGFDHEAGEQQLQQMAQLESQILTQLGWEGSGLISAADAAGFEEADNSSNISSSTAQPDSSRSDSDSSASSSSSSSGDEASSQTAATGSSDHK